MRQGKGAGGSVSTSLHKSIFVRHFLHELGACQNGTQISTNHQNTQDLNVDEILYVRSMVANSM